MIHKQTKRPYEKRPLCSKTDKVHAHGTTQCITHDVMRFEAVENSLLGETLGTTKSVVD